MDSSNIGNIKIRFVFNSLMDEMQNVSSKKAAGQQETPLNVNDGFTRSGAPGETKFDPQALNVSVGDRENLVVPSNIDIGSRIDRFFDKESATQGNRYLIRRDKGDKQDDGQTITIIHTNDLHGKFDDKGGVGGMENVSNTINEIREQNPNYILVDAGDIAYNPSFSDRHRFDPMPEIMNKIGYDVLGPGNHEYQWEADKYGGVNGNPDPNRTDNLKELTQALNFPVVNCNTVLEDTGKRPDWLKPFTIKNVGGVNVGVTAICTKKMATDAHPLVADNWTVNDPSDSLREIIPEMKAAGADVIVVLAHDSLGRNQKVIENTPGIDIMIGAHDHQTTEKPIMVTDPDGREVPLVEAFSHTKLVGELEVSIDPKSKTITGVESTLHQVDGGKNADPEIERIVRDKT